MKAPSKVLQKTGTQQMIQAGRQILYHKIMKILVICTSFIIPIIFGYWRYQSTSESHRSLDAIGWTIVSMPFSTGLWMSVFCSNRRLKYFSLLMILVGIPFHIMFSIHPFYFLPLVIIVEIYAIYSILRKNVQ